MCSVIVSMDSAESTGRRPWAFGLRVITLRLHWFASSFQLWCWMCVASRDVNCSPLFFVLSLRSGVESHCADAAHIVLMLIGVGFVLSSLCRAVASLVWQPLVRSA